MYPNYKETLEVKELSDFVYFNYLKKNFESGKEYRPLNIWSRKVAPDTRKLDTEKLWSQVKSS